MPDRLPADHSRRLTALLALESGLLDVGSRQAQGHDIAAEQAGRDESSLHLSLAGGFTDLPSTIAFSHGGGIGTELASERTIRAAQLLREALSLLTADGSLVAPSRPADRLIKLHDVERLTGFGRSAIYEWMQRGAFPKSVKVGTRSATWSEAAVQAWIANRVAGQPV